MKLKDKYNYRNEHFYELRDSARNATSAYQNAARFLDTVKEYVDIEMGMPNTAYAIHLEAHKMPQRFDVIGDILHQRHLLQEYPATPELLENIDDMDKAFEIIIGTLDDIEDALASLVQVCEKLNLYPLARQVENLQIQNSEDYTKFLTAWAVWDESLSKTSYDNWALHYFANWEGENE